MNKHTLKPCSVGCKCSVSWCEKDHWCSHILLQNSIVDRHPYQMPCVPSAQRHHCKGKKPVRGNKHLSRANWSVKCTNCGGEGDVSAGVTALGLGAMSGPGISWEASPSPQAHSRPHHLLRGTMATIIYWMSASFPHIHPGWTTQGHRGWHSPPCVITEGQQWQNNLCEHLDHLFRALGVRLKPNSPHLCAAVRSLRLSLQVGHECKQWKVHQAGCQRTSSQTNTNTTWRSFCEQCESEKCMINWACQGGFMAVKFCGWSQALLWLWLFGIMGVDSVLLAAIEARFIWILCTNKQQSLSERKTKF